MIYIESSDEDTILNAKKYLEIIEKIKKNRDCSVDEYRWLNANSDTLENDIRNILLIKYSSRDNYSYVNDPKYIKLLTNPQILERFSSQVYFGFPGSPEGFDIKCIKLIPEVESYLKEFLNEMDIKIEKHEYHNKSSKRVFIVHGKHNEMKISVARLLEKLSLKPIILHEQPNKGRTIIEKFEDYSDVGFAVVLLSPDDLGFSKDHKPESAKPRVRQNVILELGFFIGKIGRERVTALLLEQENFEMPSDILGIVYIPYDNKGAWKYHLIDELKSSGYDVKKDDI